MEDTEVRGGHQTSAESQDKGTENRSKGNRSSGEFREEKLAVDIGTFLRAEKGRAFSLILI